MSFYKMLFKNTIIICTVFSLLITVCISIVSYHYVKNEYAADADASINRISANLEYNLFQVQDLPVLFKSNDSIKNYVESDILSSEDSINIYKYLRFTINAMPSIRHNIAVSKIYDNKIISNTASSTFDYFMDSYNISREDIEERLNEFSENTFATTSTLVSTKNGSNYLIVFFCDRFSFKDDYFIISVLDLDSIISIPENTIFALQNYDKLIYYSDNNIIDKMDNKDFLSKYTVISKDSTVLNLLGTLTYTIFIPKKQYFKLVYRFIILILPIILFLFVLSYFISKKSSNKLYKPVEQLIDQVGGITLTGMEDEFKSIAVAISSLTQQNAKYHDDMAKKSIYLKNQFFHDLFTGFLSGDQIEVGINQYLADIDVSFPLSVIIVNILDNSSENNAMEKNDAYSLNLLIYNLLKNTFSDSDFFHFTIIAPLVYGIVVPSGENSDLRQSLMQIALKAENMLNVNINSYIGESIYSWEEAPSAFFSTYTSFTSNLNNNTQLVMESSDMSADAAIYPIELENKLFSACVSCQKSQLEQLLDFLFNKRTTSKDFSQNTNYYISTLFYSTCMRVLTHLGISSEDVFGADYNIHIDLRNCHSFAEIHSKLLSIFGAIMDYTTTKKKSLNKQYGDDMLEFIRQNYNDPNIALVSLAEYMNMSQAYVSKLFKRSTGCNFKEYLTKIRIEKGTELLINNPDMPISEIASYVGYNNTEPFTKAFIQIHSIAPNDYRKQKHKQ